ncbi:phosphate uptake regulator PhoU [Candidatus Woesearchaeota archaeon]|nr:phosphate uptake regulator PhoU [Candidatus Woesearchaeota archaeon]
MVIIKRKVVQHGPSTLIISLPSKWVRQHNVRKGDELDVEDTGNNIVISPQKRESLEKVTLDISAFGNMIPRTIYSMYRRGVDELIISFKNQDSFSLVQSSLGKETVGFEILETGNNHCLIKNVSEGGKEFNHLLRQTFLLLLSMAEEGHKALKQGNFKLLGNLISLEEANNRFTNLCRRYLNTKGSEDFDKIGPIYYIIEQLEKIADTYKYMYSYLAGINRENLKVNKELLENFYEINKTLRKYYDLFYKFSPQQVAELKDGRDKIIKELYLTSSKISKPYDIIFFHHLMELVTEIFSLVDPYLILSIKDSAKTG